MNWNRGHDAIFAEGKLSVGMFFPIGAFAVGDRPDMSDQLDLAKAVEAFGFSALWARDVPLDDPGFGDPGQLFDPFVWLTAVAGVTTSIALATGASVLSLRPALDTAKQAASLDILSGGRFVLGTASGDRPVEFAAFGADHATRGDRFRANFEAIKPLLQGGIDRLGDHATSPRFLPQPDAAVPMLITGFSQSPPEWGADWADGLLTYPRPPETQAKVAKRWRRPCSERYIQNPSHSRSMLTLRQILIARRPLSILDGDWGAPACSIF